MAALTNFAPTGYAMFRGSDLNLIVAQVNNLTGNGTAGAVSATTVAASSTITATGTLVATNAATVGTTLGVTGVASLSGGTTETGAHIDTLTTVAAAGATQGTATAIAAGANVVLITVTASTEGVKLPTPVAGRRVTIIANTAVGNKVYPAAAGQSIGTATTATTAFVLAKTTVTTFWASSTTKWNALKGA